MIDFLKSKDKEGYGKWIEKYDLPKDIPSEGILFNLIGSGM